METTQTPTPEQAAQVAYHFAANELINRQRTGEDVIDMLKEQGLDHETADTIVYNIQQQMAEVKSKRAKKDMLYGGLWLFGGIIVTAFTYANASEGGGRYVVAWGAILFGGIQFCRGLFANA